MTSFWRRGAAELQRDGAREIRQAKLVRLGDNRLRLLAGHDLAAALRRWKFRIRQDLRQIAAGRVAKFLAVFHGDPKQLNAPIGAPRIGKRAIFPRSSPIAEPSPHVIRRHRVDAVRAAAQGR